MHPLDKNSCFQGLLVRIFCQTIWSEYKWYCLCGLREPSTLHILMTFQLKRFTLALPATQIIWILQYFDSKTKNTHFLFCKKKSNLFRSTSSTLWSIVRPLYCSPFSAFITKYLLLLLPFPLTCNCESDDDKFSTQHLQSHLSDEIF